jgi:hypothetical protein
MPTQDHDDRYCRGVQGLFRYPVRDWRVAARRMRQLLDMVTDAGFQVQ